MPCIIRFFGDLPRAPLHPRTPMGYPVGVWFKLLMVCWPCICFQCWKLRKLIPNMPCIIRFFRDPFWTPRDPQGAWGPPGGSQSITKTQRYLWLPTAMVQNHFKLLYGTNLLVSPFIASAKCNLRIAQLRAILTHSNSNFFKGCRIPRLLRLIWTKTKLVFVQISLKSWGILQPLKKFEFEWYFTTMILTNSEKTGLTAQSRRLKIHYITKKKCWQWVHIS